MNLSFDIWQLPSKYFFSLMFQDFNISLPLPFALMEKGANVGETDEVTQELQDILNSFHPQILSEDDANTIYKCLRDNKPTEGISILFSLSRPIKSEKIEKLIQQNIKEEKHKMTVDNLLIKSAAVWLFMSKENQTIENLLVLLKSLLFISHPRYIVASTGLFAFIFTFYVSKFNVLSLEKFSNVLSSFIEKRLSMLIKENANAFNYVPYHFLETLLRIEGLPNKELVNIIHILASCGEELKNNAAYIHKLFTSSLGRIKEDEESVEILHEMMQYTLTNKNSVDDEYVAFIGEAVTKAEGESPSQKTFDLMSAIIVGEQDGEIIKNPSLVIPFIKCFIQSNLLMNCFYVIYKMRKYSFENMCILHKAGVDLELVKIIEQYDESLDKMSMFIGCALQLLSNIAICMSSIKVVSAVLGLLKPDSNGNLSKLHSTLVATLANTLSACTNNSAAFIPLEKNSLVVKFSGIHASTIQSGVHFGMWLLIPEDTPDVDVKLFSIHDAKEVGFLASIKGDKLCIHQSNARKEAEITFNQNLPVGEWFSLGVTFNFEEKKVLCIQTINDVVYPEIESVWEGFDNSSNLNITFGTQEGGKAYLGLSGVFHNNVDKVKMFKDGPRHYSQDSISYLIPRCVNGHLHVSINETSQVSSSLDRPDIALPLSFLDVLVRSCKIKSLIPLFDTVDLCFSDGERAPIFVNAILDIIFIAMNASQAAEHEFTENDGFMLIADALSRSNERNLSYSFYQAVYLQFLKLEREETRLAVLDCLILNFELWIHAPNSEQLSILRHWGRIVYPNFTELAIKTHSFCDILTLLRMYYWYTPIEEDIIRFGPNSDMKRPSNLDVSACRQNIIQLLHFLARTRFDKHSFRGLIGNCVTCKDNKQIVDLLLLIMMIAVSEEQPFMTLPDELDLFNSLLHLINHENEDVSFSAIEDLAALHLVKCITSPKLKYYVAMLMETAPLSTFSSVFFSKVIPFSKKYPGFMPLCFYYVLLSNESNEQMMMRHMEPSEEYVQYKTWALWPCITALYKGGEFLEKTIDFVARCTNEHWWITFSIIDVVARALGVDDQKPKSVFIHSLVRSLLDKPLLNYEHLHNFFDLAIFHMFFRPVHSKQLHIIDCIDAFKDEKQGEIEELPSKVDKPFNKIALINAMKELKPVEYKFGLRMSRDGKWLDADCAIDLIKQARRTKVQTYHNFSALLAAFAIKDCGEKAYEQIAALAQAKIADESFMKFIQYKDPRQNDNIAGKSDATQCFEKIIFVATPHNEEIIKNSEVVIEKLLDYFGKVDKSFAEVFSKTDSDLFSSATRETTYKASMIISEIENAQVDSKRLRICFSTQSAPWHSKVLRKDDDDKIVVLTSEPTALNIPIKIVESRRSDLVKRGQLIEDFNDPNEYIKFVTIPKPNNMKLTVLDNSILLALQGSLVSIDGKASCVFNVYTDKIQLVLTNRRISLTSADIERIIFKSLYHLPTGLEIITRDNRAYLVMLEGFNSYTVLRAIKSLPEFAGKDIEVQDQIEFLKSENITEQWSKGVISNFEYIMELNNIAGRSFNNLSTYPIVPWVLIPSDKAIDLNDPSVYRDLKNPMSKDASSVSSPAVVCTLLSHIEPFTTYCDCIDGCSKYENYNDLYNLAVDKGFELIPQFYSSSVCFENLKSFPFGAKTANEFVDIMRKAIESPFVTEQLPHWIDLTFGVDQINKDVELTEKVWETIQDNNEKGTKIASILKKMEVEGIVPTKIFDKKHPIHAVQSIKNEKMVTTVNEGSFKFASINRNTLACVKFNEETKSQKIHLYEILNLSTGLSLNSLRELEVKKIIASIAAVGDDAIVYGTDSGILVRTSPDMKQWVGYDGLTCVVHDGYEIACGSLDGCVTVVDSRTFNVLLSFPLFSGKVCCLAVSDEFGTIVAGCECSFVVISEQNRAPVIDIPTAVAPTAVCITKNYGTACIALNNEIKTYSINGQFLKSAVIEGCEKITSMCSCPINGMDCIAVAGNNKVFVIDSVLLKVIKEFSVSEDSYDEILSLDFSKEFESISCFTKYGKLVTFIL